MRQCPESTNPDLVIAVGASAGGLKEISLIVEQLPEWFQGTLIVATHREPTQENFLAEVLAQRARVRVDEPEDEDCLERTTIYVGKAKDRVEVEGDQFDIEEDRSDFARIRRIDDLFTSVAKSAGKNAVGVILSGLLSDGVQGLRAIHEAGGYCIVQSPDDADFDCMPRNALQAVPASFVGTTQQIASRIMELSLGKGITTDHWE